MDINEEFADTRAALEAQGDDRKVEAVGLNMDETAMTVARAMAGEAHLAQELSVERVMEKADDIVHAYTERIKNQKEIIDRLLDGSDRDIQAELSRALEQVAHRDSRIHNLEKQVAKHERRLKKMRGGRPE
jgi:hypothetical protein